MSHIDSSARSVLEQGLTGEGSYADYVVDDSPREFAFGRGLVFGLAIGLIFWTVVIVAILHA